jgi:hypothetical protein
MARTPTAPTPESALNGAGSPPRTALSRCVGDVAAFLDSCWGQAPLHRPAADEGAFADLFSLDDIDRLVTSSFARTPTFRLVRNGSPVSPARYTKTARVGGQPVSGVGDPAKVLDEFGTGATIVLQGLQRYCTPVGAFCRSLEAELTHPVQANAYVTPAGAQGLAVHYDTHDVFVLQVAGSKEWAIHDPVFPDPLPSQPWAQHKAGPPSPRLEVNLRAGDCLYVPRGFLHSARAQRDASAHLTIGIHTPTFCDVVSELAKVAADDRDLRRSLPPGYAHDEEAFAKVVDQTLTGMRDWLDTVDARAVAARVVRAFWSSRPPDLSGQLHQLLTLDRIDDATRLRRRGGVASPATAPVTVDTDAPGTVTLHLGDRRLVLPAALERALARFAPAAIVAVGELADLLDGDSRLVLARRLVREGFVEIVDLA